MAVKNALYAQSGGVSALIKPACSVLQTARQQSDQIAKVYAGRNGIIVRAQQLGLEDPDRRRSASWRWGRSSTDPIK